jgi:hypothetical protein
MAKLPLPPADLAAVGIRPEELRTIAVTAVWWRIHDVGTQPATPWNQLRYFGPLGLRFEPHEPPPRMHGDRAVWYAAATPRTALAEVFQRTRVVRRAPNRYLASARLSREVALLDVTGDVGHGAWSTRAGASMALATGRHDYSSAWARAICAAFPELDGIAYRAAMEGGLAVALFHPARDAMPTAPVSNRSLADPAMAPRLAAACDGIGYELV